MAAVEHPPVEVDAPDVEGASGIRWKITADEFERLYAAGFLQQDGRVELLDGEILIMSPIGNPHVSVTIRLIRLLSSTLSDRGLITASTPVRLDDLSEPQPDVTLLRFRDDFYENAHARPADIFVAIEVMETSAAYDRGRKLKKYASSGVPEVWLVDIKQKRVEMYRRPIGDLYSEISVRTRGETVTVEAFPDVMLAVNDILG